MSLRDEILEQPEVAARFLRRAPEVVGPLAEAIRARGVDHVVIAARGTSDHAAIYAQYVLGVRHALSVGLGTPSVISLYGAQPRLDRSLVVGISQSGASPDVVAVIEAGRRQGAPDAGHHERPGLGARDGRGDDHRPRRRAGARDRRDEDVHDRAPGDRRAVGGACPATRPTRRRSPRSPTRSPRTLALEPDVESMAVEQVDADRLLVLARGYEYATAREWALKLKELARVFADPYSAADFEHGPLALLEPGVPVLATIRPGPTFASLVALLGRLRADLDADLAVVSDADEALALARWPFRLPAGTPGVARADRVDRRRAAPRAAPDARSRPRPGGAAQPQQGDADALSRPRSATLGHPSRAARTNRRFDRRRATGDRSRRRLVTLVVGVPKAGWACVDGEHGSADLARHRDARGRCAAGFLVPTIASDLSAKPEVEAAVAESPVARQFINAFTADDQGVLTSMGVAADAKLRATPVPSPSSPGSTRRSISARTSLAAFSLHAYAAHVVLPDGSEDIRSWRVATAGGQAALIAPPTPIEEP